MVIFFFGERKEGEEGGIDENILVFFGLRGFFVYVIFSGKIRNVLGKWG